MEKNVKKILKTIGISIVISIIYEAALKFIFNAATNYLIDKIIVDSLILSFIGFHISFGVSKLYEFIIEHRFKIAGVCIIIFTLLQYSGSSNGILTNWILEPNKNNIILGIARGIHSDEYALETLINISQKNNNYAYENNLLRGKSTDVFSILHTPVKDIVSVGRIFNIGYLFLNSGMGLAMWWNLRFFALILVSFELFSLITNKNKKISCCATVITVFSGVCQWWFSHHLVDIIIFGQLVIVLLDKFMLSNNFKHKILYSFGIGISAISYVFIQYPAWMISFGYVFFALGIWILIKNRKEYKFNFKDFILVLLNLILVVGISYRYYMLSGETLNIIKNTSYPGERFENGGRSIPYLFTYLYNFLLPFMNLGDNYSLASIISLFPIPMIMAIFYIYKKEKHISFLLPLSIVAVLETVFCISGFPEIISKITLLNYTLVERVAVAVNFANFYLLIYMLSNIQENLVGIKVAIRITLLIICIVAFVPLPTAISGRGYISLFAALLCLYIFAFLNNGDSRYRKVLLSIMVIFTLIGGIFVNPITKGIYAVTSTDFAKEIQKVTSKDKDALWITTDNMMVLANYAVANGAKTLNSTNTYPNTEFFETVLGKEKAKEQKDIWNRYAHIEIVIDEENKVELEDKDKVKLYITIEKLQELNIDYIITYDEEILEKGIELEKIYEKKNEEEVELNNEKVNGLYIYRVL